MKYETPYNKTVLLFLILNFVFCNNKQGKNSSATYPQNKSTPTLKPPSSFQDSLFVDAMAVVFFYPDSQQMEKIKAITEKGMYNSTTHEYIYQIRNANIFLKSYWPNLKIINAKENRFLVFIKSDGTREIIDLDRKDPFGMIVFNKKKSPQLIDMMNVDTQVPMYFNN